MKGIVLYCRAGFEGECAAEIQQWAADRGVHGYCRARPGQAFVVFFPHQPASLAHLAPQLQLQELVFARQFFFLLQAFDDLPPRDRLGPILQALQDRRYDSLLVEYPDTNEGKALSPLCRKFSRPLSRALEERGQLDAHGQEDRRLHVFFHASGSALVGDVDPGKAAPWPLGILRLKFPREAPSRSTLKLEEALHVFLSPQERAQRLREGLTAVDLGAAPGGWTWQLVRHGLQVTAVDNGPMAENLMATGQVEHVRADGFKYRPPRPVNWLVCDMVEKPSRVAALMADWLVCGEAQEAIFNLKLPMKKRLATVDACRDLIGERLADAGLSASLRVRHLYHDREEVTAHLRLRGSRAGEAA